MAATERKDGLGGILLAALALPGLLPTPAQAENAPEHAQLAFKQLYYHDYQPGLQRITVLAPSIYANVPISPAWGVEASSVVDSVSGASPRYYTDKTGASHMDDLRTAGDVKFTHYRERSAYSLGLSYSSEHDYVSRSVSLDGRWSSADNNTTVNAGAAYSSDSIDPTNDIVQNESRRTWQGIVGLTQAISTQDLVQLQAGYSSGSGYFNDPYKLFDNRPDSRRQSTGVLRWNHYFKPLHATLRSSYRYYRDSFGIRAHTLQEEWVQSLGPSVSWTTGLRYDTQSAANFYVDPPANGAPFPTLPDGAYSSLDQRLAAFGGLTFSQKLAWDVGRHWRFDVKGEFSEQRSSLRLIGTGSPGLDAFNYYALQVGIAYTF